MHALPRFPLNRLSAALLVLLAQVAHAQTAPAPTTLPTGGQVVAGQASISSNGALMTIQQGSARAAIDWQRFNIGAQAQVQFLQPDAGSVTLNRVLDPNPSQIFGRLTANGRVFLSNPSGIYFAPGASVNVGALVATTRSMGTAEFMAGADAFAPDAARGSIVNLGELHAPGGIALQAGGLIQQGGRVSADSLTERGGRIVLEAASIALDAGSQTTADGASGGGQVLVGGGWQGGGGLQ
ncbi:MAG TPA: filamentous hemagglutinin N-terminal domain-containing protein, partial [Roseateles sp.]